jgi:hypothetical protein
MERSGLQSSKVVVTQGLDGRISPSELSADLTQGMPEIQLFTALL